MFEKLRGLNQIIIVHLPGLSSGKTEMGLKYSELYIIIGINCYWFNNNFLFIAVLLESDSEANLSWHVSWVML